MYVRYFKILKKLKDTDWVIEQNAFCQTFQTTSCLWPTFSDNTIVSGYDKRHIALLPNQ